MINVKNSLIAYVPKWLWSLLQHGNRYRRVIPYLGLKHQCPCCGIRLRRFAPAGQPVRPYAICPRCRSYERHRWLWLYLERYTPLLNGNRLSVLHFAPAQCLYSRFLSLSHLHYVTTDLFPKEREMLSMDITQISFASNSFDVILCNHVLEHIPDDRWAMSELCRVLKPGGWAILTVPIKMDKLTYEDDSITSPEDRRKAFGQEDHVRVYGHDYVNRLQEAGFHVKIETANQYLSEEDTRKYGFDSGEIIFLCEKFSPQA